jgi:hypothetical protein
VVIFLLCDSEFFVTQFRAYSLAIGATANWWFFFSQMSSQAWSTFQFRHSSSPTL